jgi:hypothetical protein
MGHYPTSTLREISEILSKLVMQVLRLYGFFLPSMARKMGLLFARAVHKKVCHYYIILLYYRSEWKYQRKMSIFIGIDNF